MTPPQPPYPGIPTTTDGSGSVAYVETHVTDGACGYPITPSTPIPQNYQEAVSQGMKNLWGDPIVFFEPESEHSAASACEGFAAAGGRVTNFTSGQGLILMKEVLYTISGKRLPAVFHIGARALTSHSLNIHAGHDDVMGVSDCGWGMVFARNAQEASDLALISRRAAEACEVPFLNIQDGFLTTHTVESLLLPEPDLMKEFVGRSSEKLNDLMSTETALMSGVVQNQDSYMKGKIAQRAFYGEMKGALEEAYTRFAELTGREYRHVDPYRCDDAELILVAIGTTAETAAAVVDHLREQGRKVGVAHITTFRPFPGPELARTLANAKAVAVLERMDNPGASDNPLTLEVKACLLDAIAGEEGYDKIEKLPTLYSGSAGLGSRDVRPGDLVALFDHLEAGKTTAAGRWFCLGIDHPTGIAPAEDPDVRPKQAFSMRGHSVGGYGSVTTNKVIATMASDIFGLTVQAYPKYGSEKKGLPTTYYLTIAPDRIRTHCELHQVEFIPLNDVNAFNLGDPLFGLQEGGSIFIQTHLEDPEAVWRLIPESSRNTICRLGARVLYLDTVKIAREIASVPDLVQRMQGIVLLGIFLKSTPFAERSGIGHDELMSGVERSLRKYFGKRGDRVVQDNLRCVQRGHDEVREIGLEIMEGAVAAAS